MGRSCRPGQAAERQGVRFKNHIGPRTELISRHYLGRLGVIGHSSAQEAIGPLLGELARAGKDHWHLGIADSQPTQHVVSCAEIASSMARGAKRPGITSMVSVGNDLKLEVAALARLLSRLVLYASIYMLLRLAISLTVLRTSSDAERDLEI